MWGQNLLTRYQKLNFSANIEKDLSICTYNNFISSTKNWNKSVYKSRLMRNMVRRYIPFEWYEKGSISLRVIRWIRSGFRCTQKAFPATPTKIDD